MTVEMKSSMLRVARPILAVLALLVWMLPVFFDSYTLDVSESSVPNELHREAIIAQAGAIGMTDQTYWNVPGFVSDLKSVLRPAHDALATDDASSQWSEDTYLFALTRASGTGYLSSRPLPFLLLWLLVAILAAAYFVVRHLSSAPNDNNYKVTPGTLGNTSDRVKATHGIQVRLQQALVIMTIIGFLCFGYFNSNGNILLPVLTAAVVAFIPDDTVVGSPRN
jgi:hypothetical protein